MLSEVEPDAVPNEVRNWLSMTFTRSVSNMKKKQDDKPKFKSVAQAIRAGIMVDRMLRRMSSSLESNVPAQVSKVLKASPHQTSPLLMVISRSTDWSL